MNDPPKLEGPRVHLFYTPQRTDRRLSARMQGLPRASADCYAGKAGRGTDANIKVCRADSRATHSNGRPSPAAHILVAGRDDRCTRAPESNDAQRYYQLLRISSRLPSHAMPTLCGVCAGEQPSFGLTHADFLLALKERLPKRTYHALHKAIGSRIEIPRVVKRLQ